MDLSIGDVIKGEHVMQAFDNKALEQYKDEAKTKWGQTDAYREYADKTKDYSGDKWNYLASELETVFAEFANCMKNEETPGSECAQSLVRKLQNHISDNYYVCTKEILVGLGKMYVSDERFQNNFNRHATGNAAFVAEAISIYCSDEQ